MIQLRIARPLLVGLPAVLLLATGCPELIDDDFGALQSDPATDAASVSQGGETGAFVANAGRGGQPSSGTEQAGAAGAPTQNDSAGSGGVASTLDSGGSSGIGTTSNGGSSGTSSAQANGSCDSGTVIGPNGNCYLIVTASASWGGSRSNCQARGPGWDLAAIHSMDDSDFLASILTTEVWVGANDDGTERWRWVNSGTEFWQGSGLTGSALNSAYVDWNSDEPNGAGGLDCLRILPTAAWADLDCTSGLPALCEGPAN